MKYNNQIDNNKSIKKIYQKILYGLIKRNYYYLSSPFRVLPECFVIGVVRSGTTSLYHYLGQHPCIVSSAYDELGYFDDNYHLGINWYKSLFPTKSTKNKIIKKHGKFLTYDVTFEEMVHMAMDELEKNKSRLNDEAYIVDTYYENILARGFYANQLEIWFKKFQKEQLLMIPSEELAQKPDQVLRKIFEFLNLPYFKIKDFTKQNKREYPPMKDETRKLLIEFYKPHNEKLYSLVNQHFDWDK